MPPDRASRPAVVLACLRAHAVLTAAQIGVRLGLGASCVLRALRILRDAGQVERVPAPAGSLHPWLGWRATQTPESATLTITEDHR